MYNKLLKILIKSRSSSSESARVFNKALSLSLEWGENWLQPINERMAKAYPSLSEEELISLNEKCKTIQSEVLSLCVELMDGKLNERDLKEQIKSKYPEIDKKNMRQLIRQSKYYVQR